MNEKSPQGTFCTECGDPRQAHSWRSNGTMDGGNMHSCRVCGAGAPNTPYCHGWFETWGNLPEEIRSRARTGKQI